MKDTQRKRLLQWLRTGSPINPLESWRELGIYRLSARIYDLRKEGWQIKEKRVEVRNQYGEVARVSEYRIGGAA